MKEDRVSWEKIDKIKKRVDCISCGRRIEVSNFNQQLCKKCGYRDKSSKTHGENDKD